MPDTNHKQASSPRTIAKPLRDFLVANAEVVREMQASGRGVREIRDHLISLGMLQFTVSATERAIRALSLKVRRRNQSARKPIKAARNPAELGASARRAACLEFLRGHRERLARLVSSGSSWDAILTEFARIGMPGCSRADLRSAADALGLSSADAVGLSSAEVAGASEAVADVSCAEAFKLHEAHIRELMSSGESYRGLRAYLVSQGMPSFSIEALRQTAKSIGVTSINNSGARPATIRHIKLHQKDVAAMLKQGSSHAAVRDYLVTQGMPWRTTQAVVYALTQLEMQRTKLLGRRMRSSYGEAIAKHKTAIEQILSAGGSFAKVQKFLEDNGHPSPSLMSVYRECVRLGLKSQNASTTDLASPKCRDAIASLRGEVARLLEGGGTVPDVRSLLADNGYPSYAVATILLALSKEGLSTSRQFGELASCRSVIQANKGHIAQMRQSGASLTKIGDFLASKGARPSTTVYLGQELLRAGIARKPKLGEALRP